MAEKIGQLRSNQESHAGVNVSLIVWHLIETAPSFSVLPAVILLLNK